MNTPNIIYILNKDGKPLMPSTRTKHIKRLLDKGKARIKSHTPFIVQLKYQTTNYTQPLHGGTDPGRTNIGEAVINNKGEVIYQAHITTRNKQIPKLMAERRQHRQASRRGERLKRKRRAKKAKTTTNKYNNNGRMLPGYKEPVMVKDIKNTEARFNNRKRPASWITPTVRQLIQTHVNMIKKICKILPVTDWALETNRFAFMKMDDGTIQGTDFQNGKLKGYPSVNAYIHELQNGKCAVCGNPIEHYHHLVPRSQGGSNTPENIVGLCKHCHEKVHLKKLNLTKLGIKKKYAALSVLNQAIPFILQETKKLFGANGIHTCLGYQTAEYRSRHNIPKDHPIDAACIAAIGNKLNLKNTKIHRYEILQFRKHNRQLIHAQQERTYKQEKTTTAKNRTPRYEQPKQQPSLRDWYHETKKSLNKKQARILSSRMKVIPSTRHYNTSGRIMAGSIFRYQGITHILTGQLTNGKYLRSYDEPKKNYPAIQSIIITHNSGLVYL